MSTPGTVLITGTTSGVGLNATCALVKRGWTVITANRSPQRAAAAADELDLPKERLKHVLMDLGDLDSVRRAVDSLPERLDAVVCNAAVYKPKLKQPERSPQGYEISMATNHFGHFLLVQLLLDRLKASTHPSKRVVILGTVTANSKELGGKIPIPAPADLGDLSGFEAGFKDPVTMASGKPFKPGKAYKDSKLCNLLMALQIHQQRPDIPVVAWSPGLVIPRTSEGFFRNSRQANPLGQALFGLVARDLLRLTESVERAGALLVQLIDEQLDQPGFSYWSNALLGPGRHQFKPTEPSEEAKNSDTATMLWMLSNNLINSFLTPSR